MAMSICGNTDFLNSDFLRVLKRGRKLTIGLLPAFSTIAAAQLGSQE